MRFEFNNIDWNTTIDRVFGDSQDGAKIKEFFNYAKDNYKILYSHMEERFKFLKTIPQKKGCDQEERNIVLGMLHIVETKFVAKTDGLSEKVEDKNVSNLISEILTGILSKHMEYSTSPQGYSDIIYHEIEEGRLQITKANAKFIIYAFAQSFCTHNLSSLHKLFNAFEGRNKQKGWLCGALYGHLLEGNNAKLELEENERTIIVEWSQHMHSDDYQAKKIAFLEKADLKLIEDLIENGFVRANQGNAEVLNKLLDVVGNNIELLKKLIENGFVRSAKPEPGAESEPAVEPEQRPFNRLLKRLEQLSDNGNTDAFECLTSLFPKRLSFQEITSSGLSKETIHKIFESRKVDVKKHINTMIDQGTPLAFIKIARALGAEYLDNMIKLSDHKLPFSEEGLNTKKLIVDIILAKNKITEHNVKRIIDELRCDQDSWQELYNALEDNERNAEKGLLCGELCKQIAESFFRESNMHIVERKVTTEWSQHMNRKTWLELLQNGRNHKTIVALLIAEIIIGKYKGDQEILNNVLTHTGNKDLGKVISQRFIEAVNGDLDLLEILLNKAQGDINLITSLVDNDFVKAVNTSRGEENKKEAILNKLNGFLGEIQEQGTKNDKTEASNLLETIRWKTVSSSRAPLKLPVTSPDRVLPSPAPVAQPPASQVNTTPSQKPPSVPPVQRPVPPVQQPVPPVNTTPKQQSEKKITLEIPDNKANANQSILPLVGGATAGLAVGGLGAAAILSSASKIAFVEALKCYNIIVPVAIALAVMGGVIASQQSQTER
jgi:hypothetical protein